MADSSNAAQLASVTFGESYANVADFRWTSGSHEDRHALRRIEPCRADEIRDLAIDRLEVTR